MVAQPAQGPIKQHSEHRATIPAQEMNIMVAPEPGSGKAIVARLDFYRKNWQSRCGHEFGGCPKVCSSFHYGDRCKSPHETMKQFLSRTLTIKCPSPSGAAIWVNQIFDHT